MSETLVGPDTKSIQPILQPALLSGALQSTNSSSIFYTPSKGTIEENWQESEQRTSLEALKNIPIHAQISSLENLDAPFIPIPKTPDGQSWTEPVSGDEGNAVAGGTTQEILQRTSLEALASLPTENHSSWAGNPEAISIPIPDSGDEDFSTGVKRKRKKRKKENDDSTTPSSTKQYALTINTLRTNLPHLKNVHLNSSRQRVVKVECYDYSDNTLSSRQSFSTHLKRRRGDFYTDEGVSLRYVLQDHPPPAGQLRLLVVEDLSTDLIACLGTLLKISPEVFEEHLVNSGWRNGEYDDDESDTWITRNMVKTYTTLRWFRPVKRKLQRPYSESDFATLLKARGQAFPWTETVPNKSGRDFGVKHESRPTTNIIRSELNLKTDKEEDPESGDLIGWEEKATIWCRQVEEYKIVLLLLDPLPILQEELSGSRKALELIGVNQAPDVPTAPLQNDRRDDDDERAPQSIAPKPLIRTRTHFRYDNGTGRSLFHWMLGRSNPDEGLTEDGTITAQSEDPEKAQGGKKRGRKGKFVSRPKPRNRLAETLLRLVGNTSKNAKRVNGAEEPEVLQEREGTEKLILQPLDRCIFDGLYPRGPALDYDLLLSSPDTNLLAEYLDTSKSTARTFADWLSSDDKVQSAGTLSSNPLENLFVIAHRDTLNVLRLIDVALKEIGQQVLDDTLIQERLVHWRHLLENFEAELQRLDQSLRGFAKFIEEAFTTSTSGGNIPESASSTDSLLRNCIDQISEVRRRTSRSYKSLMANLSIAESKRGIAEAESVTKLTELAFFFIPLTFSASLFSMQIKEINADSLSVAAFLAVAIIITTCSYALRLFIRSESVIEFRRHCAGEIRADGKIPSGGFIPTSVFLIWVWHRIGLLAITITVLVVVLTVPLIFVWTRNMNHGYKAIITVLELLLVLGTSYLVVNATLYFDPRGRLHFRRDMFAKQSAASGKAFIQTRSTGVRFTLPASSSLSSRWFLFILTATLIALGPMVAVWTRPLVTGIKVGVTIVIGFIYAGSVIAVILYTVSSTSHAINDDDSE